VAWRLRGQAFHSTWWLLVPRLMKWQGWCPILPGVKRHPCHVTELPLGRVDAGHHCHIEEGGSGGFA